MSLDFDAVVIGAGFGGMSMLHRLRLEGFEDGALRHSCCDAVVTNGYEGFAVI